MSPDESGPPSLLHAALPPLLLSLAVVAGGPPDPITQLSAFVTALALALAATYWLVRDGWERLGFRATHNSLRVLFGSWLVLVVGGGVLAPPLALDATAAWVVAGVVYATAVVLATWLAYRGGVARLRRALGA